MTEPEKKIFLDKEYVEKLKHIREQTEKVWKYMCYVQADTFKKEWASDESLSEEECQYNDRERLCEMLCCLINDAEYIIENIMLSLKGVERGEQSDS